ncbi:hypothetical protein [Gemmatimonas sp.]|uniref:hypothetical protein n=1 Tax=Gemmatimonas sp. TaxID=1962908 RepID=UPI00286E3EAB|nr:hypothetical protein [Gemmatimonas sp.]
MISAARRFVEALALGAACAAVSVLPAQATGGTTGGATGGSKPKATAPKLPAQKLPDFTKVPTSFEGLFAERESRAVDVLGYLRCLEATVNALRAGALGGVERGWSLTCIKQKNEWRGIFGELTDTPPGMQVKVQFALRNPGPTPDSRSGMVVRDPVDTVLASGTARALLRGLAATAPGNGLGQFVPVALAQKNFTEVWFVPSANRPERAVVGGDSLIQMSSDGMRELGHASSTPKMRVVSIPMGGSTYTLESSEDRIPLLTELMLARLAIDVLPEVRVRTREYDAILTRSTKKWTFVKR